MKYIRNQECNNTHSLASELLSYKLYRKCHRPQIELLFSVYICVSFVHVMLFFHASYNEIYLYLNINLIKNNLLYYLYFFFKRLLSRFCVTQVCNKRIHDMLKISGVCCAILNK